MAGEQNVETAKRAYAAFSAGDAEEAMASIADDVEWITPGNSTISGTMHGKQEWERNGANLPRRASARRRNIGFRTRSEWSC
jgi:ketosteroid isomerase-like protein